MDQAICRQFKTQMLNKHGRDFVFCRDDATFDTKQQIFNARFNHQEKEKQPVLVAECANAEEVVDCVDFAKEQGIPIRVKSGGHNHAGWSTGESAMIIHLAKNVHDIELINGNKQAWIYPGSRLGNVYKRLQEDNKTIPGGVCKFVNVGGLTQGGGWGLSVRKLGLTIDSLVEAEIVVAGGKDEKARVVTVNATDQGNNSDLFWAIRGGGGGNFGVVTKFLFNLSDLDKKAHVFRIHWSKEYMKEIVGAWIDFHKADEHDGLSTFLRLSVPTSKQNKAVFNATEAECNSAVLMVGMYYGTKDDLMTILRDQFFSKAAPECEQYRHTTFKTAQSLLMGFSDDSQLDIEDDQLDKAKKDDSFALHHGSEATEKAVPHKVTSMFPKDDFGEDAINALLGFVQKTHDFPTNARTYVSLHAMGGKVAEVDEADTAFAFRKKPFIIQPQAWWEKLDDRHTSDYLDWINDCRVAMANYTEGAFVNFPDLNLDTEAYYGKEHYEKLQRIKGMYDPDNHFNYPKGIPPKVSDDAN